MKDFNVFLKTNGMEYRPFYHILTKESLDNKLFSPRDEFAHKDTFGHALLVAGSYGKAGACVLSARAALRSGLGLLTVHIPKSLYNILQISVPEAMVTTDDNENFFSENVNTENYSAVAIGCGLGTDNQTKQALCQLLQANTKPLIIDADGLNLLAQIPDFASLLKEDTVLTPHPKEFERLFGKFASYEEKINFIRSFSMQTGVTIVLKGGITAVSVKTGEIFFNTAGNAGMATAGSGDVLTGILLGILSQGYTTEETAKLGVYLHALAGDKAKEKTGEVSLTASDIISNLSEVIVQNSQSVE
ncbi:MAG: NAD(P)H-hydrate dehydratase [Bacteroidales bacterium]|nr:NAD(P)H-hydrate dehydratase [Bacteroidales bacterium]